MTAMGLPPARPALALRHATMPRISATSPATTPPNGIQKPEAGHDADDERGDGQPGGLPARLTGIASGSAVRLRVAGGRDLVPRRRDLVARGGACW